AKVSRALTLREATANRPLTCGAPRNGLAQAGTRREYVHVASSSASMPPTVPSWANPFHDANPSGRLDASALSRSGGHDAGRSGRRGKGGALWRNRGGCLAAG